jgi:hypothetical protein
MNMMNQMLLLTLVSCFQSKVGPHIYENKIGIDVP